MKPESSSGLTDVAIAFRQDEFEILAFMAVETLEFVRNRNILIVLFAKEDSLQLIGVDGLRVADSSIFPRITNGNLNGPSIMVGEKIADHILDRQLAPENARPWVHPEWETAQR